MAELAVPTELPAELRARTDAELERLIAADASGEPYIVWRTADGSHGVLVLHEPDRVTIGRRQTNDIVLAGDPKVSRTHAELTRVDSDWTLVDDGLSSNGTFVGGVRLSGRHRLTHGDLMRCGGTVLQYRDAGGGSSSLTTLEGRPARVTNVTRRQQDVLVALARPQLLGGPDAPLATNEEIADELVLTVPSVKEHLRNLFQVFGLADEKPNQKRARLVQLAIDDELISKRHISRDRSSR